MIHPTDPNRADRPDPSAGRRRAPAPRPTTPSASRRAVLARLAAVAAAPAGLPWLAGCRRTGPSIVLYTSADDHVVRMVLAAWNERDDAIEVRTVGDSELKKTTGLVERLRAEADVPVCDVFWSSEVFQTVGLAEDGLLRPFDPGPRDLIDGAPRDEEGRWHACAARARVICHDPARVPADEAPRAWTDLVRPQWKGRIVMADPRFGTTGGHLGAMLGWWDRRVMRGYYAAWLDGLADNEVRLLPGGNAQVVQAVADGEADLGLTDTDDVLAIRARGRTMAMVPALHGLDEGATGVGTLLIPNTVGLVANRGGGAVTTAHAERFARFLLSPEVEAILAASSSGNMPLDRATLERFPERRIEDPLAIDYARAAARREDAVRLAMDRLADGG